MKIISRVSRKFGFTETESKIIFFLLITLFVGIIIHLIKSETENPFLLEFDYSNEDSRFYQEESPLNVGDSTEKFTEKRVESKPELSDFRTEKKEGNKGIVSFSPLNKLDINGAGADQLTSLPGIGLKTAQNIVDYRTKNGRFKSIDELLFVKGIGKSKFEKIKNLISVN